MNIKQKISKRLFDFTCALLGIISLWWFLLVLVLIVTISTKSIGLFTQKRVGYKGKLFTIFKIRTMKINNSITSTVTTSDDIRLTGFGKFLRKYKLDELPQLFNVLFGQMSFVGPRPDVSGFADELKGEDKIILTVKPGITGPASIYFRNEEELLASKDDPIKYNRDVIWPQKVTMNKKYVKNHTFMGDICILFKTVSNVITE